MLFQQGQTSKEHFYMPKRSPVEHVMPSAVEDEWLMLALNASKQTSTYQQTAGFP